MRIKYFNGKEFSFLKTPTDSQDQISQSNNFTGKKKSSKGSGKENEKRQNQKEMVEKLSKGLNLLEWIQNGRSIKSQTRHLPVKINFPMGVQKVEFQGNLKGISLDGQGEYKWLEGCLEYKGEIQRGLRHGRGVLTLKDPFLFFKGNFEEGLKQGKGLLLFTSQNIFKGYFHKGLKQGFGMMGYAAKGTPSLTRNNILETGQNLKKQKKRKAQKFTKFFKPHLRKSVGSKAFKFLSRKEVNLENSILTLGKAILRNQLDDKNELKGIILGVNKKEYLTRKWSDGMVLKNGTFLDFKDQVLWEHWKHDLFVGHWR
jgi:hypothetical protein